MQSFLTWSLKFSTLPDGTCTLSYNHPAIKMQNKNKNGKISCPFCKGYFFKIFFTKGITTKILEKSGKFQN